MGKTIMKVDDIEIRTTGLETGHSLDYAVLAIKDGEVVERIDGSIDKKNWHDRDLNADINKLIKKYLPNHNVLL